MSRIHPKLSLADLAGLICAALDQAGIEAVLSGGSVVSIYSDNAYQSFDLDFIRTGLGRKVDAAMDGLGFRRQGRHWVHDGTPYLVELPPGPVQIGELTITEFAEKETKLGTLRMLTPTDCVMDRLAWFYHSNDAQGLAQALEVARRHDVDLSRIARWSEGERAAEKFRAFRRELRKREKAR
ncbi:MAG: hypothetical protein FJ091_02505 [Deltaproteobacteria bacterium]|nr:hypothetical protein [Deltaproteobacteria bacterium]